MPHVTLYRIKREDGWVSLFNGKDLEGWDIKISGYELNNNYKNTFRVENGLLRVCYDEYDKFDGEFGHIYYKTPFSYYRLRVEYRFRRGADTRRSVMGLQEQRCDASLSISCFDGTKPGFSCFD